MGFKYKTFKLSDVLVYTSGSLEKDGFFAETLDGQSKADWEAALVEGYRWIRTDNGELVILELKYSEIAGRKFIKK